MKLLDVLVSSYYQHESTHYFSDVNQRALASFSVHSLVMLYYRKTSTWTKIPDPSEMIMEEIDQLRATSIYPHNICSKECKERGKLHAL